MDQMYRIAGLNVKIDSCGRILRQAEPYKIENADHVDMVVQSHWDLVRDQYSYLSDDEGEYIFSGSSFYRQLLEKDGLMLHSSAVVVDGRAYLFSADPGTGKSTHTKLWLQMFGDRAYILNDDKPALRLENGAWYAYGTPWSGKYDISANARVPVAGIAMLERDTVNSIAPFSGMDAVSAIFGQVNRPAGMEYRVKLLELLDKLFAGVPVWKLKCNMEMDAARVSYEAMSKTR